MTIKYKEIILYITKTKIIYIFNNNIKEKEKGVIILSSTTIIIIIEGFII